MENAKKETKLSQKVVVMFEALAAFLAYIAIVAVLMYPVADAAGYLA